MFSMGAGGGAGSCPRPSHISLLRTERASESDGPLALSQPRSLLQRCRIRQRCDSPGSLFCLTQSLSLGFSVRRHRFTTNLDGSMPRSGSPAFNYAPITTYAARSYRVDSDSLHLCTLAALSIDICPPTSHINSFLFTSRKF